MNQMLAGAMLLLSMFSASLFNTVKNVSIIEGPCPGVPLAIACAQGGERIYYRPITVTNPQMTNSGELFLLLTKEGTHIQQQQAGAWNTPSTCMSIETPGHQMMGEAWSWLWYDNPPLHTVYGPIEGMAAQDLISPSFYAAISCIGTFQPGLLVH